MWHYLIEFLQLYKGGSIISHFLDDEPEAQEGLATSPRSHASRMGGWRNLYADLNPKVLNINMLTAIKIRYAKDNIIHSNLV